MRAALEYGDSCFTIADFAYCHEDDALGNPYNCSFYMLVKNGLWSGCADGCECDIAQFQRFIGELEELYDFRRERVEFQEIGYGSTAVFAMNHTGHLKISGVIYGNAGEFCLKFGFRADQTVLKDFIHSCKKMIEEAKWQ